MSEKKILGAHVFELEPRAQPAKELSDREEKSLEKIAELRGYAGRLREYAQHKLMCDKELEGDESACDCGLSALLSEAP